MMEIGSGVVAGKHERERGYSESHFFVNFSVSAARTIITHLLLTVPSICASDSGTVA